jgi:formate dehydrogenase subunit gamma
MAKQFRKGGEVHGGLAEGELRLAELCGDLIGQRGALLPILHRIQERLTYVPSELVPAIAKALNLSKAEVHGVITFYHDFRHEPPGAHIVKICQAEACQAMGSVALTEHAQTKLGVKLGKTSQDRRVTLEAVYCLGNCALSPAILIDGQPFGGMSPERLDTVLAETVNS